MSRDALDSIEPTFRDWILAFKGVDRPIGDLAGEVAKMDESLVDYSSIRRQLRANRIGLVPAVQATKDDAYKYYQMHS